MPQTHAGGLMRIELLSLPPHSRSLCSLCFWYIISSHHIKNDNEAMKSKKNVNIFKLKCLIHIKNKINSTLWYLFRLLIYFFSLFFIRETALLQSFTRNATQLPSWWDTEMILFLNVDWWRTTYFLGQHWYW